MPPKRKKDAVCLKTSEKAEEPYKKVYPIYNQLIPNRKAGSYYENIKFQRSFGTNMGKNGHTSACSGRSALRYPRKEKRVTRFGSVAGICYLCPDRNKLRMVMVEKQQLYLSCLPGRCMAKATAGTTEIWQKCIIRRGEIYQLHSEISNRIEI